MENSPIKNLLNQQRQLENLFKLPKFTANSDLVRLTVVSKELKDPFGLKKIIGKSPVAELTNISKQIFDHLNSPIPGFSVKSILPTIPSINFPNIIIPRPIDNSIFPFVPEERRTPSPEVDSTTITDEVYEESIPSEQRSIPFPDLAQIPNSVLIVGGDDDGSNNAVARVIDKLGLKAIILDDQPNGGRTSVEKLEAYANVDFVIVLLTPDYVGDLRDKNGKLTPRVCQNVISRLSYLWGALGRDKICTLRKGELELPSDYDGWFHKPIDGNVGWKLYLVKEMQYAGLPIDKNKLL